MGIAKDLLSSTLANKLAPTLRRHTEDLIYETLDRRQVPTHLDLKDIQKHVEDLQEALSSTQASLSLLKVQQESLEESIEPQDNSALHTQTQEQIQSLEANVQRLETTLASVQTQLQACTTQQQAFETRLQELEKKFAVNPPQKVTTKMCIVPGCTNKAKARSFCSNHYNKYQRGTLQGFVNSGGLCTIGKESFVVPEALQGKPFTFTDTHITVEERSFLRTDIIK